MPNLDGSRLASFQKQTAASPHMFAVGRRIPPQFRQANPLYEHLHLLGRVTPCPISHLKPGVGGPCAALRMTVDPHSDDLQIPAIGWVEADVQRWSAKSVSENANIERHNRGAHRSQSNQPLSYRGPTDSACHVAERYRLANFRRGRGVAFHATRHRRFARKARAVLPPRKVRVEEELHAAGATTASSRSCAAAAAYSSAARMSSRSK